MLYFEMIIIHLMVLVCRDYVHVTVIYCSYLVDYLVKGKYSNAFNLGSEGYSVKEIVEAARQVTGHIRIHEDEDKVIRYARCFLYQSWKLFWVGKDNTLQLGYDVENCLAVSSKHQKDSMVDIEAYHTLNSLDIVYIVLIELIY
jgi:nucleoside-diphosphate-sugar epimerase